MYNLNNPSFVLFYANWCGHCQEFMPTWNKLKTRINSEEYNIIKIESAKPLVKRIKGLQGFPTIYYIHGDKILEYNRGRDLKSLLNFLKENKN
jgi:thiol-disulfide isomerase/thioredoxin